MEWDGLARSNLTVGPKPAWARACAGFLFCGADVMRTILGSSLLLNCALAGSVAYLLLDRPSAHLPAQGIVQDASASPPGEVAIPIAEARPFHWAQIEAADYRTYIGNLRGIGCPEQTIRDIIIADVHSLYAPRIARLEQRQAGTAPATLATVSQAAQALRSEEALLLASLLGSNPAAVETSGPAAQAGPGNLSQPPAANKPVAMPLVFQRLDLASLNLNADQLQAINALRERFLSEIGGLGQDAADPAYRARWQQSQPAIDEDLEGMIGIEAFGEYQAQACARASDARPSAP